MQEIKKMQAHPDKAQAVIDSMLEWGWKLQSSQTISNKDSHLETKKNWKGENELWNVTETTTYVELTFERDTSDPVISRIIEIEKEIDSLHTTVYAGDEPTKGIGLGIVLAAGGIVLGLLIHWLLIAIGVLAGVLTIVIKSSSYAKKHAEWAKNKAIWRKEYNEISDKKAQLIAEKDRLLHRC